MIAEEWSLRFFKYALTAPFQAKLVHQKHIQTPQVLIETYGVMIRLLSVAKLTNKTHTSWCSISNLLSKVIGKSKTGGFEAQHNMVRDCTRVSCNRRLFKRQKRRHLTAHDPPGREHCLPVSSNEITLKVYVGHTGNAHILDQSLNRVSRHRIGQPLVTCSYSGCEKIDGFAWRCPWSICRGSRHHDRKT